MTANPIWLSEMALDPKRYGGDRSNGLTMPARQALACPQPTAADVMKAIQALANKISQLSKNQQAIERKLGSMTQGTRRDRRQHDCGRGLAAALGPTAS
jgi:hypothetical protein